MLLAVDLHDYNLSLFLYIKKNNIFRFFSSKKFMKISSKTHQIPPFKKKIIYEACPRTPRANAWQRHASQADSRLATRPSLQKDGPPWQILHTPMDYC